MKSRQIKDSWIAEAAPVVRETWDYLLREAAYKDRKYGGFELKRGQLFKSYKQIRNDLRWRVGYRYQCYSENQMKHCMKLLMNNGMIELVSEPRGNLITVCNYDTYQNPENYESTIEYTNNQPLSNPLINQLSIPILKEGKEVKKERNKNIGTAPPSLDELIQFFGENGYVEQGARDAFEYYEQLRHNGETFWRDGKGSPIKAWKLKMRNVWFKPVYKKRGMVY